MNQRYDHSDYALVDATIGQRLLLGFSVAEASLRSRLPAGFEPATAAPPAYLAALGPDSGELPQGPNLMLIFNDLLLNQDAQGRAQADTSARYVGFNIPSRKTDTGEKGMTHFRIFTGNPKAVPGRYRDALPARVEREHRVAGEGTTTTIYDRWRIEPETGGAIDLELTYDRGPLARIAGVEPDFPVWAALDAAIFRVYQEDTLFEVLQLGAMGVDRVQRISFRCTVPELADLFSGTEKLTSVFGNPVYTRRVFSPREGSSQALTRELGIGVVL